MWYVMNILIVNMFNFLCPLNPHLYPLLCCQDINTLVDALIDEESTLLTRRRHREGLIQLLSRLYEVDVTAEAECLNRDRWDLVKCCEYEDVS